MCRVLVFLLAALPLMAMAAQPGWLTHWQDGKAAMLMRHAMAPGVGDPSDFRLGECNTQRNLDAQGRDEARRWGDWFRTQGVEPLVLTSRWCRASDTANGFAVGEVTEFPPLDSFFRRAEQRSAAIRGMRDRLSEPARQPLVLVSHQVNITALTGLFPASGEAIIIALPLKGDAQVLGRMPVP